MGRRHNVIRRFFRTTLAVGLSVAPCAAQVPFDTDANGNPVAEQLSKIEKDTKDLAAKPLMLLDYKRRALSYQILKDDRIEEELKIAGPHGTREIRLPPKSESHLIKYYWEEPGTDPEFTRGEIHLITPIDKNAPRRRFVLVTPISGDSTGELSRSICRELFRRDFLCAYYTRAGLEHDVKSQNLSDSMRQPGLPPYSVIAERRALDVLEDMGVLREGEKIGVAGFSLGAIDAALMATVDKRIGAVAVVLGGANLAKVFTMINGRGVEGYARFREAVMTAKGWTIDEFEKNMAETVRDAEPLAYLSAIPPDQRLSADRFLLIMARGDQAIPNERTRDLYDGLAEGSETKPTIESTGGVLNFLLPKRFAHVLAIFSLGGILSDVADHFNRFVPAP